MKKYNKVFLLILLLFVFVFPVVIVGCDVNNKQTNEGYSDYKDSNSVFVSNETAWALVTEADTKIEFVFLEEFNAVTIKARFKNINAAGICGDYNATYVRSNNKTSNYLIKEDYIETLDQDYYNSLYFNYNNTNYRYYISSDDIYSNDNNPLESLQKSLMVGNSYSKEDLLYCVMEGDNYILKFKKVVDNSEDDYDNYQVLGEVVLSKNGLYQRKTEIYKTNTSSGTYKKERTFEYNSQYSYEELNEIAQTAIAKLN